MLSPPWPASTLARRRAGCAARDPRPQQPPTGAARGLAPGRREVPPGRGAGRPDPLGLPPAARRLEAPDRRSDAAAGYSRHGQRQTFESHPRKDDTGPAEFRGSWVGGERRETWEEWFRVGTFEDYLQIIRRRPEVTRNAFQRIYDMIVSRGSEEYIDSKKKIVRHRFFSDNVAAKDAVYGLDIRCSAWSTS